MEESKHKDSESSFSVPRNESPDTGDNHPPLPAKGIQRPGSFSNSKRQDLASRTFPWSAPESPTTGMGTVTPLYTQETESQRRSSLSSSRTLLPPLHHQKEHYQFGEMPSQNNWDNSAISQQRPLATSSSSQRPHHPKQQLSKKPIHNMQSIQGSPMPHLPQVSHPLSSTQSPQAPIISHSNTPTVVQYPTYLPQHQTLPVQINPYDKQSRYQSFPGYTQQLQQQQQKQHHKQQQHVQLQQGQQAQPITYSQYPITQQIDTNPNFYYQQMQQIQPIPSMQNMTPLRPQQHAPQQPPSLSIHPQQQQPQVKQQQLQQFLPPHQLYSSQNLNAQTYSYYSQQIAPQRWPTQKHDPGSGSIFSAKAPFPSVESHNKGFECSYQEGLYFSIRESSKRRKHSSPDTSKLVSDDITGEHDRITSEDRIAKSDTSIGHRKLTLGKQNDPTTKSKQGLALKEATEEYMVHHPDVINLSKNLLWAASVSEHMVKFHQYIHGNATIQHYLKQERNTQSDDFQINPNDYKIEEFYTHIHEFPKYELVNLNMIFARLTAMLSDWIKLKEQKAESLDFQPFVETKADKDNKDNKDSLARHLKSSTIPGESVSLQVVPVKPNSKQGSEVKFNSQGTLQPDLSIKVKMVCQHCGSTSTPEWRKGPEDAKTLCNACGLFHTKLVKKLGSEGAAKELKRRREEGEHMNRRI